LDRQLLAWVHLGLGVARRVENALSEQTLPRPK